MKNKIPEPVVSKSNQIGKWMYKPLRSKVIVCTCGNKYIVTRVNQVVCINCSRAAR